MSPLFLSTNRSMLLASLENISPLSWTAFSLCINRKVSVRQTGMPAQSGQLSLNGQGGCHLEGTAHGPSSETAPGLSGVGHIWAPRDCHQQNMSSLSPSPASWEGAVPRGTQDCSESRSGASTAGAPPYDAVGAESREGSGKARPRMGVGVPGEGLGTARALHSVLRLLAVWP